METELIIYRLHCNMKCNDFFRLRLDLESIREKKKKCLGK